MINKFFNFMFQNPKRWIASLVLLTLFISSGLFQLSSKFGPEVWYKKNDPLMQMYRFFEQEFGRDDTIVIAIHHPDGVLNPQTIKLLKELTDKLYLVHDIIQVDSLTNFNWVHSFDDVIEIEPMFGDEEVELSKNYVNKRAEIVMNHPELPGALISKDATTTFVTGFLKPRFGKNINNKKIVEETQELIKAYNIPPLKIVITGSSYLTHSVKSVSSGDLAFLLPVLFLVITFLIYFIFRSFRVVIISLSILVMTNILTFGISGFFGFAFSNLTFTIPIILLAICIADAVHLLSSFFSSYKVNNDILQSLRDSYKKNFKPTLMTSITTAIGFFSLATSNSTPLVEMGMVSGLGVLLAWFTSYALIGPLILTLGVRTKISKVLHNDFWWRYSKFIVEYKWPITGVFILLTIGTLNFALKNRVDFNPYDQFSKTSKIWQTNQFIKERIGGVNGPEIVIDSGSPEAAKDPSFLKKVEELAIWIGNIEGVNKVSTLIDILKQMNKTLHNDDDSFYKIPASSKAVAEELLLLSMDSHQADMIKSKISVDRRYLRMTILWNISNSKKGLDVLNQIMEKAQELGLKASATGKQSLSINMISYIFATFKSSLALSMIVITLIIIIGLRSIRMGVFSLIPNILPLLVGAAWIYLGGYFIDFSCVVAFVISLGIAVDDTIHFLVAYKENEKENSISESLFLTFKKCGNGIVLTTLILILGFWILTFSDFLVNYKLGLLTMIVLATALIGDLLFLPALLAIIKSRFSKKLSD
ncbi:hypothetical protein A9Q84_16155 [Halobacteriovorax marinus]|uniref:SSD domain-containing protein n=1 Tax=Halobacteriovorax marinus TaxID=97084 RepID=A0A1Y5F464_9BACT|nr:hypothetical protein A9Q84_16155 [Halobacteriovorax marinus]